MTPEAKRLLRALVASVVGDREDAALVCPVLQTMLYTAVKDFQRYYRIEDAQVRVRDDVILRDYWREKEQKDLARVGLRGDSTDSPTASTD